MDRSNGLNIYDNKVTNPMFTNEIVIIALNVAVPLQDLTAT